jgi:hypothetical protein
MVVGPELRSATAIAVGEVVELEVRPTSSRRALENAREQARAMTAREGLSSPPKPPAGS